MKRSILSVVVALGIISLSGCNYFGSPEQKAFKEFVEKCRKDPSTVDCKSWEDSKRS